MNRPEEEIRKEEPPPPIRFHPPSKRYIIYYIGIIVFSFIVYSHSGVFLRQKNTSFVLNNAVEDITVFPSATTTINVLELLEEENLIEYINTTKGTFPTEFCYTDSSCPNGILYQQPIHISYEDPPSGTQVVIFLSVDFESWWVAGVSTAEDTITTPYNTNMTITNVCASAPQFHYIVACLLPPQLTNKYSKKSQNINHHDFNFCEKLGSLCSGICNEFVSINTTYCNLNRTIIFDDLVSNSEGQVTIKTIYRSPIVNIVIYAFLKYILMLMLQNAALFKIRKNTKLIGNPSECEEEPHTVLAQITACGGEDEVILIRNVLHTLFAMEEYLQKSRVNTMHFILNYDKMTTDLIKDGKIIINNSKNRIKLNLLLNTIKLFDLIHKDKKKMQELKQLAEEIKIINFEHHVGELKLRLQKNKLFKYLTTNRPNPYPDPKVFPKLQDYGVLVYEIQIHSRLRVTIFTPEDPVFIKPKNRKGFIERFLDRILPTLTLGKIARKIETPGKFDALESTRKYLINKYHNSPLKIEKRNIFLATIDARHAPQCKYWSVCMPFFYTKSSSKKGNISIRIENLRLHQQIHQYDANRRMDFMGLECGGFFYETNYLRSLVNCTTSSGSQSIVHLGDVNRNEEFKFACSIVEDLATSLKYIMDEKFSYSSYMDAVYSTMKSEENFLISVVRWSAGSVENFIRTMNPFSANFKYFIFIVLFVESYCIGLTVWTNYMEKQSIFYTILFEACIFLYLAFFFCFSQYRTFHTCIVLYLAITYPFVSALTSFFWTIFIVGALSFGMVIQLNTFAIILVAALSLICTVSIQRIILESQKQAHVPCVKKLRKDQKKDIKMRENKDKLRKKEEKKNKVEKFATSSNNLLESGAIIQQDIGEYSYLVITENEQKVDRYDYSHHPISGKGGHLNFQAFAFRNWMTSALTQPFVIIAGFMCYFDRPVWNMNVFKSIFKYCLAVQCLFYAVCILYPGCLAAYYYIIGQNSEIASVGWLGAVFAVLYLILIYPSLTRAWNFQSVVIGNSCVSFIIAISSILLFTIFCASSFTFFSTQFQTVSFSASQISTFTNAR